MPRRNAGDFDSSGEDIERDFLARTSCWEHSERVALTAAQVVEFELPPQPGKVTDPRAAAFAAEHGRLVQVEVDALEPGRLRQLLDVALAQWWDPAAAAVVRAAEEQDQRLLGEE